MRHTKRWMALALLVALTLILTGCGASKAKPDYSKGDSAAFVTRVANAVLVRLDGPELFYAGDAIQYDLDATPVLQPYFAFISFKAEADADDPALVHYSCRIPGVVCACFNMAYDTCFTAGPLYSKWVKVAGDVRVVTDAEGNRQIDISGGDNAFAAYAALRYINPLYFSVNGVSIAEAFSNEHFAEGMNIVLNRGADSYAAALGVEPTQYGEEVVIPELQKFQDKIKTLASFRDGNNGFIIWYMLYGLGGIAKYIGLGIAGLIALILLIKLIARAVSAVDAQRELSGKKNRGGGRQPRILPDGADAMQAMDAIAQRESSGAASLKVFSEGALEKPMAYQSLEDVRVAAKLAVILAQQPVDSDDAMRMLCKNIHQGLRLYDAEIKGKDPEAYRHELLTAAGWSAAALGRMLAQKMPLTGGAIPKNMERLNAAIEHSGQIADKLQEQYDKRKALAEQHSGLNPKLNTAKHLALEIQTAEVAIAELELEHSKGLGVFMLENGDLPLAYLILILRDSQNRYPRFIKQGVIMGLVDWLVENRSDPDAEALLKTLIAVRASMIQSNNELTFFEVRVPKGCTRADYAALLKDVLHCANPSMQYGDTDALLEIAQKEIPGVMDLLYACPLRLIDPVNRRTMGFYQFKPYVHEMWVQYVPPERTGKVIQRYHEVDDRTKPLSSGLNLTLFTDCYAVIPTLYHEYQHFKGDRNEASVFLKTQVFSIAFYRKYRQADAKSDNVFATLTAALGVPPAAEKVGALNKLIEGAYGVQLPRDEAIQKADAEIENINKFVDMANAAETWDPEVKMPRLSADGDAKNMNLIRSIVIRFATVPKAIGERAFDAILKGWAKPLQEMTGMPISGGLQNLEQRLGQGTGPDEYLYCMLTLIDRPVPQNNTCGELVKLREAEEISHDELEDVRRLLSENRLNVRTCEGNLSVWADSKVALEAKAMPKYVQAAARRARERGSDAVEMKDLVNALLQKPTKAMRLAGIVKAKK